MSTKTYGTVGGGDDDEGEDLMRSLTSEDGFKKSRSCNDIFFAILYLAHLAALIYVYIYDEKHKNEQQQSSSNENQSFTDSISDSISSLGQQQLTEASQASLENALQDKGVTNFVAITAGIAIAMSIVSLGIMAAFSECLVQFALLLVLTGMAAVLGYGIFISQIWMIAVGGVGLLAGIIFVCCVWRRVPFAAANLKTAIRAIRTNLGLVIMAFFWEGVALAWTILWMKAANAAMNRTHWSIIFAYLLSFFWTQQIINNLQHTIAASLLGTWWYNPTDANSCWDDGLNYAICHSITLSFGSICFGSLLASIVEAFKWLLRILNAQTQAESGGQCSCSCLAACVDCCLTCIQETIEYFNKWAFTFVGIHGSSYLQSGKKVLALFKQRGWVDIITDQLAAMVMTAVTVTISLCSGLVGLWLVRAQDDIFKGIGISEKNDDIPGFVAGALVGYIVAGIMMELVSSTINAVIVCFAEAPAVFAKTHPVLCREMLEAWKGAYPDECADDFDDVPEYNKTAQVY